MSTDEKKVGRGRRLDDLGGARLLAEFDPEDEEDLAAMAAVFSPEAIERNFRCEDGSVDFERGNRLTVEKLREIRPSVLRGDV